MIVKENNKASVLFGQIESSKNVVESLSYIFTRPSEILASLSVLDKQKGI
jgi:hypothetical protein